MLWINLFMCEYGNCCDMILLCHSTGEKIMLYIAGMSGIYVFVVRMKIVTLKIKIKQIFKSFR